jgi:transposase
MTLRMNLIWLFPKRLRDSALSTITQLLRNVVDCQEKEGPMRPLQLPVPTAEQLIALGDLYRKTKSIRERTRAQMVLLALEKHLKAGEIAAIVRQDDETVRRWLKRWKAEGVEGLKDRPRPGGPSKITREYEEQLLARVRVRPRSLGLAYSMWTLQRLADYMAGQMGVLVSDETIRRLLAAGDDRV